MWVYSYIADNCVVRREKLRYFKCCRRCSFIPGYNSASVDNWFRTLRVHYIVRSRSQWPPGLKTLDCWDCGFEPRWGHGCRFLVLCDVWVSASATSWSLVDKSPTVCVVCVCVCVVCVCLRVCGVCLCVWCVYVCVCVWCVWCVCVCVCVWCVWCMCILYVCVLASLTFHTFHENLWEIYATDGHR